MLIFLKNKGLEFYLNFFLNKITLKELKIIFKVEDKFDDYFEVFEEQNGGKYQMIDSVYLEKWRLGPIPKKIITCKNNQNFDKIRSQKTLQ